VCKQKPNGWIAVS